jgi:hypothetical protein
MNSESREQHERGCLLLSTNLERDNQVEVDEIFREALLHAQKTGKLSRKADVKALVCRIVNVFTNGSQWCMLASCLFHLRLNCPSRTQIASSYSRFPVIAARPEEWFSASTLSLARPREWPITFWHVTCLPLCQPYCYGGGDLTAAG